LYICNGCCGCLEQLSQDFFAKWIKRCVAISFTLSTQNFIPCFLTFPQNPQISNSLTTLTTNSLLHQLVAVHQLTPSPACRRSPTHSRSSLLPPSSSSLWLHTLSLSHSQPSPHNRFSFLSLPNPNLALNRSNRCYNRWFIFFSHPILLRFQLTRSTIHHRWFYCSESLVNQLC